MVIENIQIASGLLLYEAKFEMIIALFSFFAGHVKHSQNHSISSALQL